MTVGKPRRTFYLPAASVTAQLQAVFIHLAQAGGTDRLAIGNAAAVGIDRQTAVDARFTARDQILLLAMRAKAVLGHMNDFGAGIGVLQLSDIDFRGSHTGHRECLACGIDGPVDGRRKRRNLAGLAADDGFGLVEGDIRDDDAVERLFAAGRFDTVVHLAARAGVPLDRITLLPEEPGAALDAFVAAIPPGGAGYVRPTYTAMLDLRKVLAERGAVETFWRQ